MSKVNQRQLVLGLPVFLLLMMQILAHFLQLHIVDLLYKDEHIGIIWLNKVIWSVGDRGINSTSNQCVCVRSETALWFHMKEIAVVPQERDRCVP